MATASISVASESDDFPPFDSLISLDEASKLLRMSIPAIHRWRLHPTTPLKAWKLGHRWATTIDEVHAFVRLRTAAATPNREGGSAAAAPAPPHSPKRRKQIADAVERCKKMGC